MIPLILILIAVSWFLDGHFVRPLALLLIGISLAL